MPGMIKATIEGEGLPGKEIRARPAIRRRVATCVVSAPVPEACVSTFIAPRPRRRRVAGQHALGCLPSQLLPAGPRPLAAVPPVVPGKPEGGVRAGRSAFFGARAGLAAAPAFAGRLSELRRAEWVVYAKFPVAGTAAVLAYLGRYRHRVAISNSRLLEEVVRFLAAAPSLKHQTALMTAYAAGLRVSEVVRQRGADIACRNRHCPECQRSAREAWLAERQAELLPVPYFHIGFTAMHKMPSRYAFRLEDLRAWHVVEAACGSCRHRAMIGHLSLVHGRSSSMRLADLETNLRCRHCGRRGGRTRLQWVCAHATNSGAT